MAKGNSVIVKDRHKNPLFEGIINTAEKPGTIMQIDPTVALVSDVFTLIVFTRDADGDRPKGPILVLMEDHYQGKTMSDAYVAGDRGFCFTPLPGDECHVLFKNVAGTADDVVEGNLMIVDTGTGKVIVTTGTPEDEPFMACEAITDPTADTLLWVVRCG